MLRGTDVTLVVRPSSGGLMVSGVGPVVTVRVVRKGEAKLVAVGSGIAPRAV